MRRIKKQIHDFIWRERTVRWGDEYPDQRFYVIRRHADQAGLFSFVATNLGSINEAVRRGFVPVIDMQNAANPMLLPEEVGKVNAWDRYFLPPCGYTLEDIAHAKNVTLGVITPPEDEYYPDYNMILDAEELAMWRETADRYLKLRPEAEEKIDGYCEEVLHRNPGEKVLGVLCRGTDYLQQRPYNHPMQPKTEAVIAKCREVMKEYGCSRIYLCTEDQRIWDQMQEAFPEQILSYQKRRYQTGSGENINDAGNAVMSPYERNLEYLISIGILARCDCLVAGAAGGTYGALLLTKGYEYEYVFRIGRYVTKEPLPGTWEYENAAE